MHRNTHIFLIIITKRFLLCNRGYIMTLLKKTWTIISYLLVARYSVCFKFFHIFYVCKSPTLLSMALSALFFNHHLVPRLCLQSIIQSITFIFYRWKSQRSFSLNHEVINQQKLTYWKPKPLPYPSNLIVYRHETQMSREWYCLK